MSKRTSEWPSAVRTDVMDILPSVRCIHFKTFVITDCGSSVRGGKNRRVQKQGCIHGIRCVLDQTEISKEHSSDKNSIFRQKLHFQTKTPFSDKNSIFGQQGRIHGIRCVLDPTEISKGLRKNSTQFRANLSLNEG